MGSKSLAAYDYLTRKGWDWERFALRFMLEDDLLFIPGWTDIVIGDSDGNTLVLTVADDYVALGEEDSSVRCPLSALSAQKIADVLEASLPTRLVVNQIWNQAKEHLPRITRRPEASFEAAHLHQLAFKEPTTDKLTGLLAGHKKDVVIARGVRPGRVAIYGWHGIMGPPMQPLNKESHDEHYQDYSHGERYVKNRCTLNGNPADYREVLKDSSYHHLASDEGPVDMRYGVAHSP